MRSVGHGRPRQWFIGPIAAGVLFLTCGAIVRAGAPTPGTTAPVAQTPSGYVATTCAPTYGPYQAYGASLTAALAARYAVAPAFDASGDVFVATATANHTTGGSTEYYYSGIQEIAPGGKNVATFTVPLSTDLEFAVSNGYLAYVATGGVTQTLSFVNLASGSVSNAPRPTDTVYHLAAIQAGFVLTTQFAPVGDQPGTIQTYSPSGGLLASATMPGIPGESIVQLALAPSGAYVLVSTSPTGANGRYPSYLYTVDGASGAISSPVSISLGEPDDDVFVLPHDMLLFANGTDQTSNVELWNAGSSAPASTSTAAPTRVWSQAVTMDGGFVPDGTLIWAGGGLHPVQGQNGTISFTGTPGISQISATTGAPSGPLATQIAEPLWPLAAGPFGVVAVSQGSTNDLEILDPAGHAVQTQPLTLPPDTAIHAWTFELGSQYVMLSNLYPGDAVIWPSACQTNTKGA